MMSEIVMPEWLARLSDRVRGGLPPEERAGWWDRLSAAIPPGAVIGDDVADRIAVARLEWLLELAPSWPEEVRDTVVAAVRDVITVLTVGGDRRAAESAAEWSAAWAAWATESAAASAAWAARSAAWATESATESAVRAAVRAAERSAERAALRAAERSALRAAAESAAWSAEADRIIAALSALGEETDHG